MSMIDVDDKISMAKSEVSLKSNSRLTPPPNEITSALKNKKSFFSLNKTYLSLWSLMFCIFVSCGLTAYFECVNLSYVKANATTYVVYPPSFLTYITTSWLILFYPIQSLSYFMKNEKKMSFSDRFMQSIYGLFPDRKQKCRYTFRLFLLIVFWNTMINCILRSAGHIDVTDMVILFCTNSPIRYMLYWVMMHKKFVALRIIAFLLTSSGMIVNVYINTRIMWYKVLMAVGAVTYSVFLVYSRSFLVPRNPEMLSVLYSILALLNIIFTWPIFLFTSVVTTAETIDWSQMPWSFVIGSCIALLVLIMTSELSNIMSPRGIRNLLYILAIPIAYLIQLYWIQPQSSSTTVPILQIISTAFVLAAIIMTSTPSSWLNRFAARVFRKPSPAHERRRLSHHINNTIQPVGGGRTGSQYMGNGGPGASQLLHRDSSAMEMLQRIGNIGSHIFSGGPRGTITGSSASTTRSRLGSIFA